MYYMRETKNLNRWMNADISKTGDKVDKNNVMLTRQTNDVMADCDKLTRKLNIIYGMLIRLKDDVKDTDDVMYTIYLRLIRNCRTLRDSITKQIRFLHVLKNAVKVKTISEEIMKEYKYALKSISNRLERVSATIFPTYFEPTPFGAYDKYLKGLGSSLDEDLDRYLEQCEDDRFNNYIQHIFDVTKDIEYDYEFYIKRYKEQIRRSDEYRAAKQEEDKRKRIKDKINKYGHLIENAAKRYDLAIRTANYNHIISQAQMHHIGLALANTNNKCYIVLVANYAGNHRGTPKFLFSGTEASNNLITLPVIYDDEEYMSDVIDTYKQKHPDTIFKVIPLN